VKAKSWQEKFDSVPSAHVSVLGKGMLGLPAGARLLISDPREIAAAIRAVPPGQTITVAELRNRLAVAHSADATCPLTTGIFLRIVAEASLESESGVPFWRAIDPKSPLAKKISIGSAGIQARRDAEMGLGPV